jgi:hypothetical protein
VFRYDAEDPAPRVKPKRKRKAAKKKVADPVA